MMRWLIVILVTINLALATDLMVNGNFEQDLSVGWQESYLGSGYVINRTTTLQPDPDYEVEVFKNNSNGYVVLQQTVDIPGTDVGFACTARLNAYDNTAGDWAGSAFVIAYLNSSDQTLGETRICQYSTDCPWTASPTLHLIVAVDNAWHDYSFNINDELANLPGVNPLEISKLRIALFDTSKWCGG
jgi:hypothetical protein